MDIQFTQEELELMESLDKMFILVDCAKKNIVRRRY